MVLEYDCYYYGTNGNDFFYSGNDVGRSYFQGEAGNDTYRLHNLVGTFNYIVDSAGTADVLLMDDVQGNDIMLLFDVMVNETNSEHPHDELFIVHKNKINTFKDELKDYVVHNYNQNYLPTAGAVVIESYFGDTNNIQGNGKYGTNWGTGNIEGIRTIDGTLGSKSTVEVKEYIQRVTPKIRTFLAGVGYNSSLELLTSNNDALKLQLLSLYVNNPIKFTVAGTSNDEVLSGGEEADTIKGMDGYDTIYGNGGNDKLYGGNGNDQIFAGAGNDSIWGEKGDDEINLESGNNIMVFEAGDGNDIVYSGTGSDILQFNNIASSSQFVTKLKFSSVNNQDLVIQYTNNDSVTIKDFFTNNSIKKIKAKDGSAMAFSTLMNKTKIEVEVTDYYNGKSHHENIIGSEAVDIIGGNGGNDTIYGYGGDDKLYGGEGNDRIEGGDGSDVIDGGVGNDALYGLSGDDKIKAGAGDDFVNGGNGNDIIWCESGANRIIGGAGDDKIYAGAGVDTMEFSTNSGKDLVYDANQYDVLKFTDVNSTDVASTLKFVKKDNHLLIQRKNTTDEVKIVNYFAAEGAERINKLVTKDSKTMSLNKQQLNVNGKGEFTTTDYSEAVNGSSIADTITLCAGNDVVAPGKGNDTIYTGAGNNKIIINKGDGDDTIYHQGTKTTLKVNGATANDVVNFSKNGTDLILIYTHPKVGAEVENVKERITFKDYFDEYDTIRDEEIYLQSTSTQKISELIGDIADIGKNKITRDVLNQTTLNATQQEDIITVQNATNSKINAGSGDDVINVTTATNTIVNAGAGEDIINIKGTDLTINPGLGNDTVNIQPKGDGPVTIGSYVFNAGNGNDTINGITDAILTIDSDSLIKNFREYYFIYGEKDGNDLILKLKGGETLTVTDFYLMPEYKQNNALKCYFNDVEYSVAYKFLQLGTRPINYLTSTGTTNISENDTFNVSSVSDNIMHTVNLSGSNNYLWIDGDANYTINVTNNSNNIYFDNMTTIKTRFVDLRGNNNLIEAKGGSSLSVDIMDHNAKGNKIYCYSKCGTIRSYSTKSNSIYMYNTAVGTPSKIITTGGDYIELNGTKVNIQYDGSADRTIRVNSAEAQGANINDSRFYTGTTKIEYTFDENIDVAFYHRPKDVEEPTSDTIYIATADEYGGYNKNIISIDGKWTMNKYDTLEFNFDTDDGVNALQIKTGTNSGYLTLENMTQTLSMNDSRVNHYFYFDDSAYYGLLQHRGRTSLAGSYGDDEYDDYELWGKYIIREQGGEDSLTMNLVNIYEARTFFDINADGTLGNDLFFTDENGLSSIVSGATPDHYLKIENAFTNGGKVENVVINDGHEYQLDYARLTDANDVNSLVSDVVGWLTDRGYASVNEAIASGLDDDGIYTLCNAYNRWDDSAGFYEWQMV